MAFQFQPGTSKRRQVAEHMKRKIESGAWPVGSVVPPIFDLARDEYHCSVEVVRKAEHDLADQGWLNQPRQGLWTRVATRPDPDPRELLIQAQEAHRTLGVKLEALATALAE